MPEYDANFVSQHAPVARVTIRNASRNKSVTDVPMLIDTGAELLSSQSNLKLFIGHNCHGVLVLNIESLWSDVSSCNTVKSRLFYDQKLRGRYSE